MPRIGPTGYVSNSMKFVKNSATGYTTTSTQVNNGLISFNSIASTGSIFFPDVTIDVAKSSIVSLYANSSNVNSPPQIVLGYQNTGSAPYSSFSNSFFSQKSHNVDSGAIRPARFIPEVSNTSTDLTLLESYYTDNNSNYGAIYKDQQLVTTSFTGTTKSYTTYDNRINESNKPSEQTFILDEDDAVYISSDLDAMTYTKYDQTDYLNVDTYIQDNLSSVCKLWLSTRTIAGINNDQPIPTWTSVIGGLSASAVSGYTPATCSTASALNGYRVARFDTNSVMVVDAVTITNMNEFHLFYLYNPGDYPVLNNMGPTIHMATSFKKNFFTLDDLSISSPNSFASGFAFQINPGKYYSQIYGYSQSGSYSFSGLRIGLDPTTGGGFQDPSPGLATIGFKNQWQLIEIASGDALYFNGFPGMPIRPNYTSSFTGKLYINNINSSGQIADIILIDKRLTPYERTNIYKMLRARYNLTGQGPNRETPLTATEIPYNTYGLAYGDSKLVVTGNSFCSYSIDDGTSWNSSASNPLMNPAKTVVYSSSVGKWVLGGTRYSTNTLAYSTDAITWTGLGSTIFNTTVNKVIYANNYYLAVGFSSNTIASSSDGTTWTGRGSTYFQQGRSIAYGNSTYVAVGERRVTLVAGGAGTNTLAVSYDNGLNWTGLGSTLFGFVNNKDSGCICLAYGNNMWIAGTLNGANGGAGTDAMAYSYNGTQWVGLGTTLFTVTYDVVYGDKWVAVGNGNSQKIAYSTNGTQWTFIAADIIPAPLSIAYGNSLYIAVGGGNTNTIAWSNNGISWTGLGTSIFSGGAGIAIAYGGGIWVAMGNNGSVNSLAYSSDGSGTQWTGLGRTLFQDTSNFYLNGDIVYGSDKFVAVGGGQNSSNTIAYSYNGSQWTGIGTTIFRELARKVDYVAGRFIAVGYNNLYLTGRGFTWAYSDDGVTWTGGDNTVFSTYGASIAGDNVSIQNNYHAPISYSSDLITWTGVATTLMKHGYDIIYTDKFVCVGEAFTNSLNNILTSSDGTIWTAITNNLLSYSPTISRIITLDAETDFTGFTDGQAVTNWNGWTVVNASYPPTYSTYNGGKFVLFATNNQQLRYTGGIGFNSATNGWTINFQSINIPIGSATILTFASSTVTITIKYNNAAFDFDGFIIVVTISGVTTTIDFANGLNAGTISGGWFDATISYNHINHQFMTTISKNTRTLAMHTHILEVPNVSFTSVTFGGTGMSNMYVNRIFIYENYMEHLHAFNTSMSNSSNVFIPASFSTNWKKQAIILSKITYGNNQYLISGRDVINDNYYFGEKSVSYAFYYQHRKIMLNTSPFFKSTDGGSNWSYMFNTGLGSSSNALEYFNSKFYIVSNESFAYNTTNYSAIPTRILSTSNLDYWKNVGDKNEILVPSLSLPSAISPKQLLSSIVTIFLNYGTGVWYAVGMSNDTVPHPSVIRYKDGYWTYDYPKLQYYGNSDRVRKPSTAITSIYSADISNSSNLNTLYISTNNGVYEYSLTPFSNYVVVRIDGGSGLYGWSQSQVTGMSTFYFKSMLRDPLNSIYSYFLSNSTNKLFSYTTQSSSLTENTSANTFLTTKNCFFYNEDKFIVGGSGGSASIIYRDIYNNYNGSFTNATSAFSLMSTVNSIVASRSAVLRRWVAVGENNSTINSIIYSDDGVTWTAATNTHFITGVSVNWYNDHFIALGNGGTSNAVYSYDGITWLSHTSASNLISMTIPRLIQSYSNRMVKGVTISNNINFDTSTVGDTVPPQIILAGGATTFTTSFDGISYTSRTKPSTNVRQIVYNNGFWVAICDFSSNFTIMTSTDGMSWTGRNGIPFIFGNTIAYGLDGSGNGLYVAGGAGVNTGNSFISSTDGITWVGRGGHPDIFSTFTQKIAYGNGIWVAVGNGIDNSFAYSTNGTTWTGLGKTSLPLDSEGVGLIFANNLFVAVGSGTSHSIASSTDGTTWTGKGGKTNLISYGKGVAYANGLWVVVGAASTGGSTIITSPDLITWTARNNLFVNDSGIDVAYSPYSSIWIAVGSTINNNQKVGISTDGTTWTSISSSFTPSAIGINPNFSMATTKPYVAQVWFLTAFSPTSKDNRFSLNCFIKQVKNTIFYQVILILLVLNNLS
jgi:hypothetical protein